MAIAKGTNSYADVSEADAYFQDRLDATAWNEALPELKEQALITATAQLDDLSWIGTAVSASQPLAFPRSGNYFDPLVGSQIDLTNTVPKRVITATFELALHLLSNRDTVADSGTVETIIVGPITLQNIQKPNKLPLFIKTKVNPLLTNNGAAIWWRAN